MYTIFRHRRAITAAAVLTLFLLVGCKRESTTAAPTPNAADSSSASGPGSVSVVGNSVNYQNLRIEVPWDMSDAANAVRIAAEAAAGKGLKLGDGKDALVIASDGRSVELNGQSYGAVKPGDHVVLTRDHKLLVDGAERSPQSPRAATATTSPS
jgi:hypothetical protein